MHQFNKTHRRILALMLASSAVAGSTGCSTSGMSLASLNPFSKPSPTVGEPSAGAKFTESIASTTQGARNQLSTVGATAKSAMNKTTTTFAGFFKKSDTPSDGTSSTTDPLSLENKPASIGPEVYVANGQLWESTGNFEKAMESYTKALESEPNNGPALTSIARLHFRQNNHAQAAEFFGKAIEKSPEDAALYNDLGLTLSKLGNHAAAEQTLARALQLAPGTSRYANNLASVKFEAGDSTGAFDVLAKNNNSPVAHFNMAYLHYKKGQMDLARNHLTQVVASDADMAQDSAVKRAVDRSREMLAQIDGATSTIAQAAPQATLAARQFLGLDPQAGAPVQQTSQSTTTPVTLPGSVPAPAATSPAPAVAPIPSTSTPNSSTSTTPPAPTTPVPTTTSTGTTATGTTANQFTLPSNFSMPTTK